MALSSASTGRHVRKPAIHLCSLKPCVSSTPISKGNSECSICRCDPREAISGSASGKRWWAYPMGRLEHTEISPGWREAVHGQSGVLVALIPCLFSFPATEFWLQAAGLEGIPAPVDLRRSGYCSISNLVFHVCSECNARPQLAGDNSARGRYSSFNKKHLTRFVSSRGKKRRNVARQGCVVCATNLGLGLFS